ncbi:MAG: hypothetical protein ABFS86_03965 [Planctomycetota bacterium]
MAKAGRIAIICLTAFLLAGCIDLPDETKGLVYLFVVLHIIHIGLQVILILLLVFYFLPFTRPTRLRKK